jgi:hypothetical protein
VGNARPRGELLSAVGAGSAAAAGPAVRDAARLRYRRTEGPGAGAGDGRGRPRARPSESGRYAAGTIAFRARPLPGRRRSGAAHLGVRQAQFRHRTRRWCGRRTSPTSTTSRRC